MKVGIITFHNVNNYGSVLQTYATQETFKKLGCDAEIIDYSRENEKDYKSKLLAACKRSSFNKNFFSRFVYYVIKMPSYRRQKVVFEDFMNKNICLSRKKYISNEQLKKDSGIYDVVCTGSDQMWNSEYNGGIEKAYYLDFAEKQSKKIAYSTSIGMEKFPDSQVQTIQDYLKKYDAISVRESSALNVLDAIGISNAIQVLDPTLVLTRNEWLSIASSKYQNHKPYVLIYQLNPNNEFDSFAEKLANSNGWDLLRINLLYDQFMKCGKGINIPKIEDFISLFANAQCVVTDSFHGTAFCINLNTQFCVFNPPKYSTRLTSILNTMSLENRVIKDSTMPNEKIDFQKVNAILNRERDKNIEFLREALNL